MRCVTSVERCSILFPPNFHILGNAVYVYVLASGRADAIMRLWIEWEETGVNVTNSEMRPLIFEFHALKP